MIWEVHESLMTRTYGTVGTRENINMRTLVRRFVADESGATAIEYGLIAAGIAVAIITVVQGLGTKLNATFANITSKIK